MGHGADMEARASHISRLWSSVPENYGGADRGAIG